MGKGQGRMARHPVSITTAHRCLAQQAVRVRGARLAQRLTGGQGRLDEDDSVEFVGLAESDHDQARRSQPAGTMQNQRLAGLARKLAGLVELLEQALAGMIDLLQRALEGLVDGDADDQGVGRKL